MDLSTPNTTGADTLVITLSEDAWQGDAQFTVAVDGQQVGGEYTAATQSGTGTDTLTLHGDWGSGQHDIAITFLNDAYGGTSDTDRNLYVEGINYNGTAAQDATASLHSAGTVHLTVTGDAASASGTSTDTTTTTDTSTASTSGTSTDTTTSTAPVTGGQGDMPALQTVWVESFDNGGTGILSNVWGPGVVVNGDGSITIHSTPDNQDSGAMTHPDGYGTPEGGWGYGVYSFTLSMGQGDAPGPYALLWPGTDQWPGPELDLVEVLSGGQAYSTIHWKGDDGSNQYQSFMLDGVDPTQTHTYSLEWEPGRLTGYVDGKEMWTTTDHVPADAADGGENLAPGIGMQTWWAADAQHGSGSDNTITLYEVSYSVIA